MAFIDFIIDIVRNGATLQQKINVEPDATDATKIAPARVIQLNGKPLANNNAIPATVVSPSWATETTLANLSSRLPTALISGRLPIDGSAVTQPVSGTIDISNFPANQIVSGTLGISNAFALDATAIAIRDRLPMALGATLAANSLPVTLATDGLFAIAFGSADSPIATTDSANTGFISLFKRLFSKLPTALNNGRFLVDATVKTSATNPGQYNAIGTSSGANIKGTPGSIYSISCINQNASNRYLQLFNKSTTPAVNDIPIESHIVYGNGGELILGQDYFSLNGLDFASGISWGISTTATTYTAASASETIFTARFL